ncbi:MAG: helix-turn-helix domain-containing protein [Bacteroidetes bacterium]|nr:helix-turn-helix domain-containing protein [Bacteroidota bacterium]MCW5894438.1 helix-turn-helix domain-containing protein [Bacteroidota bacterium]
MKKTILSTADVARLFNVTETTVKRWANEGTLKCMKTPGGHRKFEMKHVVEFAQSLNFEPAGTLSLTQEDTLAERIQVGVLSRDFAILKNAFVEKALGTGKKDLFSYFSYLYQHRIHLWELFDLVIGPGMTEIGARWASGELDVNAEHRASYETLEALAKLQTQINTKQRKTGFRVICACPGEEQHEIGLRCSSYVFESEGWMTHYFGARTPYESILNGVRTLKPTAVCLSITTESDDKREIQQLHSMLKELHDLQPNILIGGRAVQQNGHALLEYASLYRNSFDLMAAIQNLEMKIGPVSN